MMFHCHEMRLHCFLLSVAWFQLALISSDCFESFFQSAQYGSMVCRRKFHGKGIIFQTFQPYVFILNGVVAMRVRVNPKVPGSDSARTFFFPSSFFFSFLFCFVLFAYLFCFFLFLFVFKYIPK